MLYKTWDEIKQEADSMPDKYKPLWLRDPKAMDPICGWPWILGTDHVIPELEFEIVANGMRQKVRCLKYQDEVIKSVLH